jgi:hypothetical protein
MQNSSPSYNVKSPQTAVNMPYDIRLRSFFYFNTCVVFIIEINLKIKDKNYVNKLILTVPFIVENNLKIKDEEYFRIALCCVV